MLSCASQIQMQEIVARKCIEHTVHEVFWEKNLQIHCDKRILCLFALNLLMNGFSPLKIKIRFHFKEQEIGKHAILPHLSFSIVGVCDARCHRKMLSFHSAKALLAFFC